MAEEKIGPFVIEGQCYQKGWFFGVTGEHSKKHYSIASCLTHDLHGKQVRITIEIIDKKVI